MPLPELISVAATAPSYWSDPRFDALVLVGEHFGTGITAVSQVYYDPRDASANRFLMLRSYLM